ncbi:hypothetical protein PhaeoP72_01452 [Phaeobacter inhibens]|uniref:hypothetical protein n=1 Tax=Phaeobacter inhibens TaxID=221822 RepID=UPI000C9AC385|nr:hypothetical protein [Phaeobacter inhibens]AUR03431.1 hypothetical protein PhaeoP72_01452 [Phaeobacter inhibens]
MSEYTYDLPKDALSAGARTQKSRFRETSRFFVVNELKSVRFVTEEEIRALEIFYQKDMSDLLNDKKGGRK